MMSGHTVGLIAGAFIVTVTSLYVAFWPSAPVAVVAPPAAPITGHQPNVYDQFDKDRQAKPQSFMELPDDPESGLFDRLRGLVQRETVGERLTRECQSIVEAAGFPGNRGLIRSCILERGMGSK
jgi:hypothetical protein